jgi:hypothetical protein
MAPPIIPAILTLPRVRLSDARASRAGVATRARDGDHGPRCAARAGAERLRRQLRCSACARARHGRRARGPP